jgi:hypothetical protein
MNKKLLYKILAVIAGLVFVCTGISDNRHISRLKRYGVAAVVIPPDSYVDHSQNGSHTYTAEISFKTSDNVAVTVKHSLPSEALDSMKAHRPVTIYYDPKDPTDLVFAQDKANWWLPIFGVLLAVGAVVLL